MSENPFANYKSNKCRNVVVNRPGKPFCPKTMVRFDNSPTEFKTMWFCKMCMKCLLSESAVLGHIVNCKEGTQIAVTKKIVKGTRSYNCDICNKLFSRNATLKKHEKNHDKPMLKFEELEEKFDYIKSSPKNYKEKIITPLNPNLKLLKNGVEVSNYATNIECF